MLQKLVQALLHLICLFGIFAALQCFRDFLDGFVEALDLPVGPPLDFILPALLLKPSLANPKFLSCQMDGEVEVLGNCLNWNVLLDVGSLQGIRETPRKWSGYEETEPSASQEASTEQGFWRPTCGSPDAGVYSLSVSEVNPFESVSVSSAVTGPAGGVPSQARLRNRRK